jgi:hypothetical protein
MMLVTEAFPALKPPRVQFEGFVGAEPDQNLFAARAANLKPIIVCVDALETQILLGDLQSPSATGWDPAKFLSINVFTYL